jgi:site-specific DNA recombinase
MTTRTSEDELCPRDGLCLMVAIICRISGCQRQQEASLDDQEDNGRTTADDLYDGPTHFDVIKTVGKGENLERPELEQIEAIYRSRKYDLVIYDDLSRLIRGVEAARLLGIGVDNGTRSICINDGIDTNDETWEEDAINACSQNVAHNQRTSNRIKQKTMNRFRKDGWTSRRPITGYLAPPGAKSYNGWEKDLDLEERIKRGAEILKETLNGQEVADFFNANDVPVGPHARNEKWDGTMVLRHYRNPLLKGMPQRGKMRTVKQHGSGKRVSKRNPKGPTFYHAPHLAFLDPIEFDELQVLLDDRNARYRRKGKNGEDTHLRVPRQRTRSFGQHARCWYCGRHYVWGGNGITGNLMCSGARKWRCWNSIGFPGELAAQHLVAEITKHLHSLEGLDQQFRAMVQQAGEGGPNGFAARWEKQLRGEASLSREKANAKEVIRTCGLSDLVVELLKELDARAKLLAAERKALELAATRTLRVPESPAELHALMARAFERLAIDSLDFGDLVRRLAPDVHVCLVRLCDGGHLLPRAKIRLDLLGDFPDAALLPELQRLSSVEVTIDLVDAPQRERIREAAVALAAQGMEQRAIANQIAEKPTQTAVWKALELQRLMDERGLASPYVLLTEPPADYAKLRRHLNANYRFEPLPGYVPPTL